MKFPGMSIMTIGEVAIFARTLKGDGYTTEESLEFMQGIDSCLLIQASAAIINRMSGKRKHNSKKSRDILHDAAMQIPIPERFINTNENEDKL